MGDISIGILTDNDNIIKVDIASYPNDFGDRLYGDTRILACAYYVNKNKDNVVLLSNDLNLRVRGRALGLMCEKHEKANGSTTELYAGVQYLKNEEAGTKLEADGSISAVEYDLDLQPNEYVVFTNKHGDEISKGRLSKKGKIKIVPKISPWGLVARNSEQEMLIDLIMDPKISLVTAIGHAGTGKSIVSIASCLELVLHKKVYNKVSIYKPIESVGKELGFLPGDLESKLSPIFLSVKDSFEVLFSGSGKAGTDWKRDLEMFQKKGRIEFEPITYIRGRSLPFTLMLMDECQNLDAKDVKTLLTRAGEGSKILLLGDIEQIDNKDLDASNNGLTQVIERFKGWDNFAHITLVHGERSILASKAAELL